MNLMYAANLLSNKEQCLKEYAPLVMRIAHHLMAKLPCSVSVDDIVQAGMMGLLEAAGRYNELLGAQFETFAAQRIRGAMLDELRQADWMPRSLRRDMRHIEAAIAKLQQCLGMPPSETEIARELDMPLAEYQQMLCRSRGVQLVYYEDFSGEDGGDFFDHHQTEKDADPLTLLQGEYFREALTKAIDRLPERERMLMGMLYEQEMNLREIGEVIGVSESRVCQLHSQAITRLRSALKGH